MTRFEPKELNPLDHAKIEMEASGARGFIKGFVGGGILAFVNYLSKRIDKTNGWNVAGLILLMTFGVGLHIWSFMDWYDLAEKWQTIRDGKKAATKRD